MSTQPNDYETILTLVRSWPAAQRFALVQDVLVTLAPAEWAPRSTLPHARGLLATDQAPPTDVQVAEWLNERRTERYGV
jgi:uncharacterized protein YqcC (DUF446 family)